MKIHALCVLQAVILSAVLLGGCEGEKSVVGMRLPEGNVDAGRKAFVELNCIQCHTVEGEQLVDPAQMGPVQLHLGGDVLRVKTYGDLVTAIINPEHDISSQFKLKTGEVSETVTMPDFNRMMTVQQMLDLVAFLQAHYRLHMPEYSNYIYPADTQFPE